MKREVIVGTRTSDLAMWQTYWVVKKLMERNSDYTFRIKELKTKGDKILDVALAKIGDKGLFTKELELALLAEEIDLAVHSMKDLPTELPEGLVMGAITLREQPNDVLLSPFGYTLADLPQGARLGTSSLRRRAQLLHYRPDLKIDDLRGNLNTRLDKMLTEQFDAIVLAFAGVDRLGWANRVTQLIPFDIVLPAVGQGALGVEVREEDKEILDLLQTIDDADTRTAVKVERAFLRCLEGGCQVPIGALARIDGSMLELEGVVAGIDGHKLIRRSKRGYFGQEDRLGTDLAEEILSLGGDKILSQIRQETEEG